MNKVHERLLRSRIIVLNGNIDERTANYVAEALLRLKHGGDEATLYIKSSGGNVRDGLDIYDTVSMSGVPVVGVVVGSANSMASVVLQACRLRMIARHAEIVIHNSTANIRIISRMNESGTVELDQARVIENIDYVLQRLRRIYTIFTQRTGRSLAEIVAAMNAERSFSAEEAVAFGLVDEVADEMSAMV
ncbi:hypothetical protein AUJ44_03935 [Candidatus Nomurabacteria bacterium CG1_02_47_685]|nr:MAG: hypothetical protein AUJ44_03935 [Candidatus Nomurabacteria bacterium CG1_02_47_685]